MYGTASGNTLSNSPPFGQAKERKEDEGHMIKFRELTIEDKTWIDKALENHRYYSAEYCFASIFNWRQVLNTKIGTTAEFLVTAGNYKGFSYNYFGAGDRKALIPALIADARERGKRFCLQGILESEKQELERLFPGKLIFHEDINAFDYCYTREKLSLLKGRKLSGKRNHISRFLSSVPSWSYEPITVENLWECRVMSDKWYETKGCQEGSPLWYEKQSLNTAIDNFEAEGLIGGLIRVDGNVEAFTLASPVGEDTVVVHYEKAFLNYPGCYTIINQQFAERSCARFARINREDDTGDESLRMAKRSYQPDEMIVKYWVTLSDEEMEE